MTPFEQLLYNLETTRIDVSQPFGWFHCLFLFTTLAICVIIFLFRNRLQGKAFMWFIIGMWIFMVLLEATRETIGAFNNGDIFGIGEWGWRYRWSDFPFQLCSMPLYTLLPAAVIPSKTKTQRMFKETFLSFSGTFVFFSGAVLTIYPITILDGGTSRAWYAVYTCMWHSTMAIVGFGILASRQFKFNVYSFVKAIILFGIFVIMAVAFNETFYYGVYTPLKNYVESMGGTFNGELYEMNNFWLSPHFKDILSSIIDVFPFPALYFVPVILYWIIISAGCCANIYLAKACDILSHYIFVQTKEHCPKCKDHNLVVWRNRNNSSVHCADFPICHYKVKDKTKSDKIVKKYLKNKSKKI